jgi:hypothetical protein
MKYSDSLFALIAVATALVAFSCSAPAYKESNTAQKDGTYDSEFPDKPASKQLQLISESVCTINCIGSYKVYLFEDSERLLRLDLNEQLLQKKSPVPLFSDNSVRGTATIIANDGSKIAFLTCAHVVDFPDTVIAYHVGPDGRATKYIRSVAVKMKQFNFISPFPEDGAVEIVFVDTQTDIAVLGRSLQTQMARGIAPIRYGLGNAKELDWGAFVYVFSYPAGIKMLTNAIVSSPRKDTEGTFYIDASANQGSSGGIVLAIRDGIPNFEIVGLVRVVPAKFSYYLAPGDSATEEYDPYSAYRGDAFVQKRTDLESGVTKCIPAESIRKSLERHKEQMAQRGYDCSGFLKQR